MNDLSKAIAAMKAAIKAHSRLRNALREAGYIVYVDGVALHLAALRNTLKDIQAQHEIDVLGQ